MAHRQPVGRRFFLYNTICEVILWDCPGDAEAVLNDCEDAARDVQRLLNAYDTESELGRMNQTHLVGSPYVVSPQLFSLLRQMNAFSETSDGAFDASVRPLVNLWNFTADCPEIPEKAAIDAAMRHCGYHRIRYDEAKRSVCFTEEGMMLDAGGVGKGYAAGRVREILLGSGVQSASVNFGGEMCFLGSWHHGDARTDWRIAVQKPGAPRGTPSGYLELPACAAASSGDYDRFFMAGGQRYCHILNPKTGYPVSSGLRSVTIVCEDPVKAELLSTAVFVMGAEKGSIFAAGEGAEFLMIGDFGFKMSDGLQHRFKAAV